VSDEEISILEHCTDRKLRELLALASAAAKTRRNWLLEIGDLEQMESLLTEMSPGGEPSGETLLRAVCSPDTSIESLNEIKRIAKRLAAAAEAPAQNAAATLLYHLSVASALGFQGQSISSKDQAERITLYRQLAAELPDDDLAAIFERAAARLASP
jgi:hypothetical protein